MVIRRMFGFCAAHIVRNCTSLRCSRSLHGHNYKVEVFVESKKLDNAGMILDFGIFKNEIAQFIDGFDHAYHFWGKEKQEFAKFILENSERYVRLDCNPSAENYALLFLYFIDKILGATRLGNNEGEVRVSSVRVHETEHGYAEAFREDLDNRDFMREIDLDSVEFAPAIVAGWRDSMMLEKLKHYHKQGGEKPFVCDAPSQQILC